MSQQARQRNHHRPQMEEKLSVTFLCVDFDAFCNVSSVERACK